MFALSLIILRRLNVDDGPVSDLAGLLYELIYFGQTVLCFLLLCWSIVGSAFTAAHAMSVCFAFIITDIIKHNSKSQKHIFLYIF